MIVNVWQRTQVYTMLQVNLVETSRGHVSNWFHETLDEYKIAMEIQGDLWGLIQK